MIKQIFLFVLLSNSESFVPIKKFFRNTKIFSNELNSIECDEFFYKKEYLKYLEDYKLIGYLHNNESKMLPLYGRRVHVNNTKWNYYTKSDNYSYSIHVFINYKNRDCGSEYGCDELYDDDEVYISEFNGNFRVKLYDNHYRYNPKII